jgi:hypothetical protein
MRLAFGLDDQVVGGRMNHGRRARSAKRLTYYKAFSNPEADDDRTAIRQ